MMHRWWCTGDDGIWWSLKREKQWLCDIMNKHLWRLHLFGVSSFLKFFFSFLSVDNNRFDAFIYHTTAWTKGRICMKTPLHIFDHTTATGLNACFRRLQILPGSVLISQLKFNFICCHYSLVVSFGHQTADFWFSVYWESGNIASSLAWEPYSFKMNQRLNQ